MKKWIVFISFLILLIIFYPKTQPNYKYLVKVTKFSEPSYGVFWHEPRMRLFQKAHYLPYPEMPSCDRLRFVYDLNIAYKEVKLKSNL